MYTHSPVMLQPLSDTADRFKHKFMVMAVYAPWRFKPSQLEDVVRHKSADHRVHIVICYHTYSFCSQLKKTPQQERMCSKLSCSFIEKGQTAPKPVDRSTLDLVHRGGKGGGKEMNGKWDGYIDKRRDKAPDRAASLNEGVK